VKILKDTIEAKEGSKNMLKTAVRRAVEICKIGAKGRPKNMLKIAGRRAAKICKIGTT